jgi:hypothetical protein
MSDQPIHPEEVFHSALPTGASLVVVFVPSKDRDRQLEDILVVPEQNESAREG